MYDAASCQFQLTDCSVNQSELKGKEFVLRPINKIKTLPIKLSQYHSIKIVNMPKV